MGIQAKCLKCGDWKVFPDGAPRVCDPCRPQPAIQEIPAATALKFDYGKPMIGLISTIFTVGLAKVLTFGAKKYAAHNWRNGFVHSRPYDALQRHLLAY